MSQIDVICSSITSTLDTAAADLKGFMIRSPDEIKNVVHDYLDPLHVPSFVENHVIEKMVTSLEDAVDYAFDGIIMARRLLVSRGNPDALRAARDVLASKVDGAATSLAPDIVEDSLDAMASDEWTGSASEKYAKSFGGEQGEVLRIATLSKQIEDALGGFAAGIDSFYSDLEDAVFALGTAILSVAIAIVGFETVVVLVLGLISAAVSLGQLVNELINAWNVAKGAAKDAIASLTTGAVEWKPTPFAP